MAMTLASASSQYAQRTGAVVTALPLTLACWYKPVAGTGVDYCVVCLGRLSNWHGGWSIGQRGFSYFTDRPSMWANYGDVAKVAFATASPTANTWNHLCGVFASDTSRTMYLNGGNSGTNTVNDPLIAAPQFTTIGRFGPRDAGRYFNGSVALVAIYNVALTAAEVYTLSRGVWPPLVRQANLVAFYPLWGDASLAVLDLEGKYTQTLYNTPTYTDQPRIIMPHRRVFYSVPATAGVLFWRKSPQGLFTPGRI